MWNNKNFLILSGAYALMYGVMITLSSSLSNLLNPFGYTVAEISILGGCSLLAGIIGALMVGWFLDRTALYRMTIITISAISVIAMSTTLITLAFSNNSLANIFCPLVLIGFICVAYFPAAISYGAELTFPM